MIEQQSKKKYSVDLCIVGGGSAGTGAALAAVKLGMSVALVEKFSTLGGTSTNAFISSWAPSPANQIAEDLYHTMIKLDSTAVGITTKSINSKSKHPVWSVNNDMTWNDTLRGSGTPATRACVTFTREIWNKAVLKTLQVSSGKIKLLTGFTLSSKLNKPIKADSLSSIKVYSDKQGTVEVQAKTFLDCTGNLSLCSMCGMTLGKGITAGANNATGKQLPTGINNISLAFYLDKSEGTVLSPGGKEAWMKNYQVTHFNDNYTINPLTMMGGDKFFTEPYSDLYANCHQRVSQMAQWLVSTPLFSGYRLNQVAPFLGIRESYRLLSQTILNQDDCLKNYLIKICDPATVDYIALSDHPFDIAGQTFKHQISSIYGVPFGTLVPTVGPNNLLVACRGAGFDHIAASSCRLEKVMIQLGSAAAYAAKEAINKGIPVNQVKGEDVATAMDMTSLIKFYQQLEGETKVSDVNIELNNF